jgi:Na+/proline symporter
MLSLYDHLNIAFYFLFIAGVGLYYARRNRNTSDYFRAGGALPWWMTGASAWMAAFSAWTFTGAAGKMYETGPYVFVGPYYSIIVPYLFLLLFTCYRFRRMRVVTPIEAVRLRFGAGAQQVITWLRLPIALILGGVSLNAVGVFMAAVFDVPLWLVIIVLGGAVTFLSLLGGSMGVVASDFVQTFLIVTVTVAVSVLALNLPDIGGIAGMIEKAPARHHEWGSIARPEFIALYMLAFTTMKLFEENAIDKSYKFLMARSDRHARLTVVIPLVGALIGPLLWLIPPTVAAIRHPDIASLFPDLRFPSEAAFLLTAADVLPKGMLGLLVCGIFAATLTDLDGTLNQGAGMFVRNFYMPVINPASSERRLLIVSKLTAGLFGLVVIAIGLAFNQFRASGLFDLVNQLAVSLLLPVVVPLFLGMFYRRTPSWSVWSTILIGLVCSLFVRYGAAPSLLSAIPGFAGPYTPEESVQFSFFSTVALVGGVCTAWFFFTSLFYERASAEYRGNVDEFFARLATPMEETQDADEAAQGGHGRTMGRLCIAYGGFIVLLGVLVPNALQGRLCFFACGGVMVASGLLLCRRPSAARKERGRAGQVRLTSG